MSIEEAHHVLNTYDKELNDYLTVIDSVGVVVSDDNVDPAITVSIIGGKLQWLVIADGALHWDLTELTGQINATIGAGIFLWLSKFNETLGIT